MTKVLEKDYKILERRGSESISNGLGKNKNHDIFGKKEENEKNHGFIYVSVLEKREEKTSEKTSREMGVRVWSKKERKKKAEKKEGRAIHIVNIGKIQRDRGVTIEIWNIQEFKRKKGKERGVYTRLGVYGKDSMELAKGRENLQKCVEKSIEDQDRKRIGMGMKQGESGDRKWFNIKRRNSNQLIQMLTRFTELIKTQAQKRKREKNVKEMYRITIIKTLRKQVVIMIRVTSNRNKERKK